jgi:hypothetical protein
MFNFFNGKGNAVARLLQTAVVLVAIVIAMGGAANLAARVRSTAWLAPPQAVSPAINPVCQSLFDASDKLYGTPYHMYSTQTSPQIDSGKPKAAETISVGGKLYIMTNGKWAASPVSLPEEKQLEQRNRKNATNLSCHYLFDDTADGEKASVYSAHSETERGSNDNQVWISKDKGLILRQETDMNIGGGRATAHVSARYEYDNVQAPPL